MNRLERDIKSLSFWLRGTTGHLWKIHHACREYKYSTLQFSEEDQKKLNQARDLVWQAQDLYQSVLGKHIAKVTWDKLYWG